MMKLSIMGKQVAKLVFVDGTEQELEIYPETKPLDAKIIPITRSSMHKLNERVIKRLIKAGKPL